MLTPASDSAVVNLMATLANLNVIAEGPFLNSHANPMKLGRIPNSAFDAPPSDAELSQPSLRQRCLGIGIATLNQLSLPVVEEKIPLFVNLPDKVESGKKVFDSSFLEDLVEASGEQINSSTSRVLTAGRPGALLALDYAFRYLNQGLGEHALIGGIGSFFDIVTLSLLDQEGRVLANGIADGFAPSEGAAFILVSTPESARQIRTKPLATIYTPAIAEEPGHSSSDIPNTGSGMTEVVRNAASALHSRPIQMLYSTMNGENVWAKEQGSAIIRNRGAFVENFSIEHPADCYGDLGAAVSAATLALVATGLEKRKLPSPIMVCSAADHSLRGACCLAS